MAVGASQYAVGQPVEVGLEVRNARSAPVTLVIAPEQLFDLLVLDARGVRVWAWTDSRPFPLVPPERRALEPGGVLRGPLVWDQRILRPPLQQGGSAAPATYTLQGVLHAPVVELFNLQLRTAPLTIVVRP